METRRGHRTLESILSTSLAPFRGQIAEATLYPAADDGGKDQAQQRNGSRYRSLQERVTIQEQALRNAERKMDELRRDLRAARARVVSQENVIKELSSAVSYYRFQVPRRSSQQQESENVRAKQLERLAFLKAEEDRIRALDPRVHTVFTYALGGDQVLEMDRAECSAKLESLSKALRRELASVKMQATARGFVARRVIGRRLRHRAATKVQAAYRGYRLRRDLVWST